MLSAATARDAVFLWRRVWKSHLNHLDFPASGVRRLRPYQRLAKYFIGNLPASVIQYEPFEVDNDVIFGDRSGL